MTAQDEYIKTAFEIHGMTPAQIAEDQELDITAVKAKLLSISTVFRKACRQENLEEEEFNFSDDELKEIDSIILDCARNATYPNGETDFKTRLSAATYVRDDKKGRKEARNTVQTLNFNVLSLNEKLKAANDAARQLTINVEQLK
jgi:hypothetical protein